MFSNIPKQAMIVLLFIIISLLLEEGHDYHYQHYLWTI